ncbi:FAD-binding oxidoreductase [Thiobacillus sp.]|uniref:FAD-binding oxidoreductase n=1 Tax=Thiobacillus sp. TaxID=924 RepID=UPI00183B1992|nr:FAD-binding oxidoreductase [Thiobacillus sp.]MBC2730863.1 flavodoxin reductase [Thiobacillus sp.]MBC2739600.1 flavodoxin reductase [Thiobacillus sp.]MBC2760116.1 flavodoxin reductase [Thiobacillus sp.]
MNHPVTLLRSQFVTHDVKHFIVSKPEGFSIVPGQGVELAINRPELREQSRPFTPTGLAGDRVLEFTIKAYPDHAGVTQALHQLEPGAELLMSEPFGTIRYEGPGVFIAGGAGITPFLAILRDLTGKGELDRQTLIFSNKTPRDVICERELRHVLGERCILTCTGATAPGYENRRVDRAFLEEMVSDFTQRFYVCGPPPFMDAINAALTDLGAHPESLVFER